MKGRRLPRSDARQRCREADPHRGVGTGIADHIEPGAAHELILPAAAGQYVVTRKPEHLLIRRCAPQGVGRSGSRHDNIPGGRRRRVWLGVGGGHVRHPRLNGKARDIDQRRYLEIGSAQPLPAGGQHRQELGSIADRHATGNRREDQLLKIAQPRQERQVDPVDAGLKIADHIAQPVPGQHEDVTARPAPKGIRPGAIDQNVGSRPSRHRGAPGRCHKHVIGTRPGKRCAGAAGGQPQGTDIHAKLRQARLLRRGEEHLDFVADRNHFDARHSGQRRRGGIGKALQMDQLATGDHRQKADAVIRAGDNDKDPPVDFQRIHHRDVLKACSEIVDQMVGDTQGAVTGDRENRQAGTARSRRDKIGYAIGRNRQEFAHILDRHKLSGAHRRGGKKPARRADFIAGQPMLHFRRGKEKAARPDLHGEHRRNAGGIAFRGIGEMGLKNHAPRSGPENIDSAAGTGGGIEPGLPAQRGANQLDPLTVIGNRPEKGRKRIGKTPRLDHRQNIVGNAAGVAADGQGGARQALTGLLRDLRQCAFGNAQA